MKIRIWMKIKSEQNSDYKNINFYILKVKAMNNLRDNKRAKQFN